MDTRRLQAFMKIVDAGSITRAADILHIAQPALSQQVSGLETRFGRTLLLRSKRGVVPTEAGKALYRHAQRILRQVELVEADVAVSAQFPAGCVSVGLAPLSAAPRLGLPLLVETRRRYPEVLLHLNENSGGVLSEALMTGRIDLALLYGTGPIRGVAFEPVFDEPLVLVQDGTGESSAGATVDVAGLEGLDLLLPRTVHTLRRVVDAALLSTSTTPSVVGEVESPTTLGHAVRDGLGATVLPASVAAGLPDSGSLRIRRLVDPDLTLTMSLCSSDQQPLSEPATVVRELFLETIKRFAREHDPVRLYDSASDL